MADHLDRLGAERLARLHAEHSLGYETARVIDSFPLPMAGAWAVLLQAGAAAGPHGLEFGVVVGRGQDGRLGVAQDDIGPLDHFQAKARHGKKARWAA